MPPLPPKALVKLRRYRRAQQEPIEQICAENNSVNIFDYHVPTADKPDF